MNTSTRSTDLPVVAVAMGDAAGISPELAARLAALPESRTVARMVVFGDRRVFAAGARVAGVQPDITVVPPGGATSLSGPGPFLVDLGHCDPATVPVGEVSRAGGAFSERNFRVALEYARDGHADAVCYTPLNKAAMRLAHPSFEDETGFLQEVFGTTGPASEFNILEGLWNARVTSHVPMKRVSELITREAIIEGARLTHQALLTAGIARPRIAVAALNPHAGDGGNFGREEIDVIAPAVADLLRSGLAVSGPFPAETVFLRARKGEFDAVLTMYHDQGQIAMKLMGFEKGVTLLGGFAIPVTTPAHGTAYDIAGKGIANVGATREAFLLAAKMGAARRASAR